jgi:hypothetical protein
MEQARWRVREILVHLTTPNPAHNELRLFVVVLDHATDFHDIVAVEQLSDSFGAVPDFAVQFAASIRQAN